MTQIKVRIAPSPTGYLHIGTARTALFNLLFAKKYGGKFLLRIEDTDEARNSKESYNSIIEGLKSLGLEWEGEVVYQKTRIKMHAEMTQKLIQNGVAYYCYLTQEELETRRKSAEENSERYIHKYKQGDETPKQGINPVVRIKTPKDENITVEDAVQGSVTFHSSTIDDFVILRSDGTPVYMLSVVCDDAEMGITHVIRGDDHLTNTPKQILIYKGLGVKLPTFAHIPLIHGMDGKKLSKRHGAVSAAEYIKMGYLPKAIRSYLVRLGLGVSTDEVITDEEMIKEFSLEKIHKSPAKFDYEKLKSINHFFIQQEASEDLFSILLQFKQFSNKATIISAIEVLKYRYYTMLEMAEGLMPFEKLELTEEVKKLLTESKNIIHTAIDFFTQYEGTEAEFKQFIKEQNIPFGKIGPVIRLCTLGSASSIGIFEIVKILGTKEVLSRLKSALV